MAQNFIEQLRQNLAQPLPGKESHFDMAPTVRRKYAVAPTDARIACVMALFYPGQVENDFNIALIERADSKNPNDTHRGQISFPGGKLEQDDPSHEAGALRETEEEIGIPRNDIQLIGNLTDLYIPVSNFKVFPFVGFLPQKPKFIRQESEVRSILDVPFQEIQNKSNRKVKDLRVQQNITMKNVPYFDIQGHVVWGATAMMLNELVKISPQI